MVPKPSQDGDVPSQPGSDNVQLEGSSEQMCTYGWCRVSTMYFNDKLGSYWGTILGIPVLTTILRTLVALLVGAFNGWEPTQLASGLATAALVCALMAIDVPLPCAPPAHRSEVGQCTCTQLSAFTRVQTDCPSGAF